MKPRNETREHRGAPRHEDGGHERLAEVDRRLSGRREQVLCIEKQNKGARWEETNLEEGFENNFGDAAFVDVATFKQDFRCTLADPAWDNQSTPSCAQLLRRGRNDPELDVRRGRVPHVYVGEHLKMAISANRFGRLTDALHFRRSRKFGFRHGSVARGGYIRF